jgi:hypothetical protein
MSKVFEFFLGSILITALTIALMFFSALHYVLRAGDVTSCTWQSSAKAWIDSNADGLINSGESPLSGVEVHIDDVKNQLASEGNISWPAVTNQYGDVQLHITIPGCSETVFEVYVDIPQGYRVTTSPRIEVTPDFWESLRSEKVYYFGFVADR